MGHVVLVLRPSRLFAHITGSSDERGGRTPDGFDMDFRRVFAVCAVFAGNVICVSQAAGSGGYSYPPGGPYQLPLNVATAPGQYGVYDAGDVGTSYVVGGNSRRDQECYRAPESYKFNISDFSYFYPRNDIYRELHERKDVLEQIFKDGVPGSSPATENDLLFAPLEEDLSSSVGEAVNIDRYSGCVGYTLLLRSFDAYGGRCWVVYPLHQAIRFASCGHSQCKGDNENSGYRACLPEEVPRELWAYCDTLEPGRRIVKTEVPVPVACKCLAYGC